MALLEVIAMHAADARRAEEGGADRIELVGSIDDDGFSPEPQLIEHVRLASSIRMHVMLRLRSGFGTDGGEVTRMKGLIASYLDAGADGVVLGFLNGMNLPDLQVVEELAGDGNVPYTFHRAIDHCLDQRRAWEAATQLPGDLKHILTAGSSLDVEHGLDHILEIIKAEPSLARVIMAGGGLRPEHVPWLMRAGVRAFHIGKPARPGGSYKAYVDAELVQSWRSLIDDERRRVAAADQEA